MKHHLQHAPTTHSPPSPKNSAVSLCQTFCLAPFAPRRLMQPPSKQSSILRRMESCLWDTSKIPPGGIKSVTMARVILDLHHFGKRARVTQRLGFARLVIYVFLLWDIHVCVLVCRVVTWTQTCQFYAEWLALSLYVLPKQFLSFYERSTQFVMSV